MRIEQRAAGLALGFTTAQVWRYIVFPQAIRTALGPLLGQYMNALKNSSLTMAIGLAELSYASRQVETETFKYRFRPSASPPSCMWPALR